MSWRACAVIGEFHCRWRGFVGDWGRLMGVGSCLFVPFLCDWREDGGFVGAVSVVMDGCSLVQE